MSFTLDTAFNTPHCSQMITAALELYILPSPTSFTYVWLLRLIHKFQLHQLIVTSTCLKYSQISPTDSNDQVTSSWHSYTKLWLQWVIHCISGKNSGSCPAMPRNPCPTIDSCHHLEVLRLHKYRWMHHLAQQRETMPP